LKIKPGQLWRTADRELLYLVVSRDPHAKINMVYVLCNEFGRQGGLCTWADFTWNDDELVADV